MDIDTNLNEPIEQVFDEGQPTNQVEAAPVVEQAPEVNTPWWQGDAYKDKTLEYRSSNKDVSENIETVLKRASMGYNYAQNMQGLKGERDAFVTEKQGVEDMRSKWQPYDDYARQNPQWAEHVNQAWENRGSQIQDQGTQNQQPATNIPPEFAQKIESMDNFMQNYQRQQDDRVLSDEISTVRDQYKDVDFDYSDPASGKSLEMQVLEHAHNTGINTFRAAFRDFYHDTLVRNSVEQAKKDLGSQIQANTKQGIISQGDAPRLSGNQQTYRIQSMDDAFSAAANEYGIQL